MKEVRKCKYCGKKFVPRSGMQKYCCEECQTKAKETRKKRQQDFLNAVEPVIGLQNQEYLTFAKAAILMGCSRQYVYKLVNEGKLAASRISSRMALVVFAVLGYYTEKYHLNDTMAFLWLIAAMPIFIMSVIWGINEVWAWLEMRKKKPKLRA